MGLVRGEATSPSLVHELFDQHYLGLVRVAASVVGDQETAGGVVQEAFAALPAHVDNPRGHLTTAVFNRERSVLRRDERDRVLAAVRELPDRQRQVVALRHPEEVTPSEVAELLGISKEAVASSSNRALESLRGKLGRS